MHVRHNWQHTEAIWTRSQRILAWLTYCDISWNCTVHWRIKWTDRSEVLHELWVETCYDIKGVCLCSQHMIDSLVLTLCADHWFSWFYLDISLWSRYYFDEWRISKYQKYSSAQIHVKTSRCFFNSPGLLFSALHNVVMRLECASSYHAVDRCCHCRDSLHEFFTLIFFQLQHEPRMQSCVV